MKLPYTPAALCWLELLLKERFGHDFTLIQTPSQIVLRLSGGEGEVIFDSLLDCFRSTHSDFPSCDWNGAEEGWVLPLGSPLPAAGCRELSVPLIEHEGDQYFVHYDILGLTYWMLSRLEEVGRMDLDEHDRFPATSSHAFKFNYLGRPIVDEWLNILGQLLVKKWPALELKQHHASMAVSHDVDVPSKYAFCDFRKFARVIATDIIKQRKLDPLFIGALVRSRTKRALHHRDPANTFDWIMDHSERNGLTSAFYFICGKTNPLKDADYQLEHPAIRRLLGNINKRGHEIGLHPSYNTYNNPGELKVEAEHLRSVLMQEGVCQPYIGGRMHFLRWEQPKTLQAWEDADLEYDSTLGYADHPGFRCGTCFEYPAFNPISQRILKLRLRPLIAMESSVIAPRYLGLGYGEEALTEFLSLKHKCQKLGGVFTLLWHNNHLMSGDDMRLYDSVIQG